MAIHMFQQLIDTLPAARLRGHDFIGRPAVAEAVLVEA